VGGAQGNFCGETFSPLFLIDWIERERGKTEVKEFLITFTGRGKEVENKGSADLFILSARKFNLWLVFSFSLV